MDVTLLRHATLLVELDGVRFLVDPMLSDAGANPPVENTPNQRRNPLVDLPDAVTDGDSALAHDAVLVTHRHTDHWDAWADAVDPSTPVFCNPADAEHFEADGLTDVRPVDGGETFEGVTLHRTPARHGHGDLAEAMAPVCGFVLDGTESLYIAGDTVWYDAVPETIDDHDPDAVVLNAGAAQFLEGEPITMTAEGVANVRDHVSDGTDVLAVHMDAINHCLLSRDDLREAVDDVAIPDDGETVTL
ncbi:MBL fold metallo-hydrolase [Halocalculus aciditolerans]|uniref:Metallo-beta-lactamase domain-containing protein n=1 Tax=Halocalculus aciditolerans TaxID=1383812 RepID=A0A830F0F7_9EURY|nr:MBL fold metallo-hydrolase [Halocalculus aciditolerans]GGL48964.1 hypothetical protein GCM10009039_03980 [Halocalculus aciditolerans]